jgi:hypothetical protein
MARRIAAVKSTGGEGFGFAEHVARRVPSARFFSGMGAREKDAIRRCGELTVNNAANDAMRLWQRLVGFTGKNRVSSGSVTLTGLIRARRADFAFTQFAIVNC